MRITPCKLLSLTPYANERWLTNLTLWGQLAGRRCRQKAGPKNSVAWRSSRYDLLPADVAHDRSSVSSLCQFFWRGCRDRCRRTSKTMTPARPALAVSESVRSPRRVRRLSASVRRTVRTCTPETPRSSLPTQPPTLSGKHGVHRGHAVGWNVADVRVDKRRAISRVVDVVERASVHRERNGHAARSQPDEDDHSNRSFQIVVALSTQRVADGQIALDCKRRYR